MEYGVFVYGKLAHRGCQTFAEAAMFLRRNLMKLPIGSVEIRRVDPDTE